MTNEVTAGEQFGTVFARGENGAAEFCRDDPTSATLRIEYHVPGMAVELDRDSPESLAEGVNVACEAEIEHMREAIRSLGEELSSQLTDEGSDPATQQEFDDQDERTWADKRTAFLVRPTVSESDVRLNGYEGAADAKLVEQTVENTIVQREDSVRRLYQRILDEATDARARYN